MGHGKNPEFLLWVRGNTERFENDWETLPDVDLGGSGWLLGGQQVAGSMRECPVGKYPLKWTPRPQDARNDLGAFLSWEQGSRHSILSLTDSDGHQAHYEWKWWWVARKKSVCRSQIPVITSHPLTISTMKNVGSVVWALNFTGRKVLELRLALYKR